MTFWHIRDTLKAFDDFKNKQKSVWSNVFWYVKVLHMKQGWRNGFQSGGAMEHWKWLSVTMVGRQEKFSNSRRSRMAKTIIFWPWWQPFNSFYFETLSFLPLSPFFLFATQKSERGHGPPRSPRCRRPCESVFNTLYIEINTNVKKISSRQNKWYNKCPHFTFESSNSSQFYFWFLILIWAKAQGSSL